LRSAIHDGVDGLGEGAEDRTADWRLGEIAEGVGRFEIDGLAYEIVLDEELELEVFLPAAHLAHPSAGRRSSSTSARASFNCSRFRVVSERRNRH
jgi:hypothetical protein